MRDTHITLARCHKQAFDELFGWRDAGPSNYDMPMQALAKTDKAMRFIKAENGRCYISKRLYNADTVPGGSVAS